MQRQQCNQTQVYMPRSTLATAAVAVGVLNLILASYSHQTSCVKGSYDLLGFLSAILVNKNDQNLDYLTHPLLQDGGWVEHCGRHSPWRRGTIPEGRAAATTARARMTEMTFMVDTGGGWCCTLDE